MLFYRFPSKQIPTRAKNIEKNDIKTFHYPLCDVNLRDNNKRKRKEKAARLMILSVNRK